MSAVFAASLAAPADATSLRQCPRFDAPTYYFDGVASIDPDSRDEKPPVDPAARARWEQIGQLRERHLLGWYGGALSKLREPSLSCGAPGEQYRFTWLRSFHNPVAIRIFRDAVGWHLVAVESRADGLVLRRIRKSIDEATFSAARAAALVAAGVANTRDQPGFDGARWLIEAVDENGWRLVDRWSPTSGPTRTAGEEFIRLSGWDFPVDEIY